MASLVRYDNTHRMIEDLHRKAQKRVEGDLLVADLQVVKTAFESMKSDYLSLFSDSGYILKVAGIYVDQLSKGKNEIMELNRELKLLTRHWMIHRLLFMKQKIKLGSQIILGSMRVKRGRSFSKK